jgi:hypothetical protein
MPTNDIPKGVIFETDETMTLQIVTAYICHQHFTLFAQVFMINRS